MEAMKSHTARIPVQQSFCQRCAETIKNVLSQIEDVTHVRSYPEEALVVLNFIRANEISKVLNALSDLGFPERGEERIGFDIPCIECTQILDIQRECA